ncbi:MAG: hypothetical protein U5L11_01320 [Arhodomonas sp.]|nr:hypothetical protein [Arhodomonas sp.]
MPPRILDSADHGAVVTEVVRNGLRLLCSARRAPPRGHGDAALGRRGRAPDNGGTLVLALRPDNPEGISFIHQAELDTDRYGWRVEGERTVRFDAAAARHHPPDYVHGDVAIRMGDAEGHGAGRPAPWASPLPPPGFPSSLAARFGG